MRALLIRGMIPFVWNASGAWAGGGMSVIAEQAIEEHVSQPLTLSAQPSSYEETREALQKGGANEQEIQEVLSRTQNLFKSVHHLSPETQEALLREWRQWIQKQEGATDRGPEPDIDTWEIIAVEDKQMWYNSTTDLLHQTAAVISETATKERLLRFVIVAAKCALFGQSTLIRCFFDFTLGETGVVCGKKLAQSVTDFFGFDIQTVSLSVQQEFIKLGACLMMGQAECTKNVVEAAKAVLVSASTRSAF